VSIPARTPRDESGFTLVEVVVAALILLIGVASVLGLLNVANRASAATQARDAGTNLAREIVEAARTIPYERVNSPGVIAGLEQLPGLADVPAGGAYTIPRGHIQYDVAVDVCIMDDPKDGGGPRVATATFCANSATPGTTDKNPEDYKRLTTTVTWIADGKSHNVTQTAIINNPGSASGPAVRSIAPRGFTAPYEITTNLSSIVVDVTTSSKPATVSWLQDGTRQAGNLTQNGTNGLAWQFSWPIASLDDGAYILGAEAYDIYGVSGPGRQETIVLNRFAPRAPRQLTGGRSKFGTVELEWTANSERDIIGYEVIREGSTTPVCPLATQKLDTTCTDDSPPAGPLTYYVRAYDKDPSGSPRASANSSPLVVTDANTPPNAPTTLTLARLANGSTKLSWKRAVPEDGDAGDSVNFFRIYRDGTALSNRFDRYFDSAGGATVTWTDTDTGGSSHSYWITAVDQHFGESEFVGPVTG
jgi:hypothetical protein